MDEKRTDLKAELRELAAEESGGAGPHCGLKRLIDYREGTLPAAERERVQEHLSLCPRCTGLLRELRAFEAAAAHGETGPESLRQEAWDSLAQRLPARTPAIRPVGSAAPSDPGRRFPRFVLGALAAALLLAVAGLSLWAATTVLQESQRTARLERRLEERNAALADLRSSLAETKRQLDTARRQIEDLQKERTARAGGQAPEGREPVAVASRQIEVSVAPRYVLRGHEDPGSAFLRGGGVENHVRMPSRDHRFALALNLADQPAYDEYRVELLDGDGKELWSGRRPGASVLGDAGTSVSVRGLGPGLYRLRIAGLKADRGAPLAEYLLRVKP